MEVIQSAPSITPEIPTSMEERRTRIHQSAATIFMRQPDWEIFFREILGVDGIMRKMFTKPEELAAFEKTADYAEIQQMLTKLREKSGQSEDREPTRVITVRLPKSLHEALKAEAGDRRTSMNQLCISKLLQVIAEEMAGEEEIQDPQTI